MSRIAIIGDPPGVEPAIGLSIPTLHGEDVGLVVTLATARALAKELEASVKAAERIHRGGR